MATDAQIFERYVRAEFSNRVSLLSDVPDNSILIRKPGSPQGSKEFIAVQLQDGQVLGQVAGVITGVSSSNAEIYKHIQESLVTTWVITHNRNNDDVLAAIYDENALQIYPDSLEIISPNIVHVTFLQPILGKAYLTFYA